MSKTTNGSVLRIIDANLNRLREALRVIEEYVRFIMTDKALSVEMKNLRHSLEQIEKGVGRRNLLCFRDTSNDPFAGKNLDEELNRQNPEDVLSANFKRAQEAARVLEEYVKLSEPVKTSQTAKTIRFRLYKAEKKIIKRTGDGKDKK